MRNFLAQHTIWRRGLASLIVALLGVGLFLAADHSAHSRLHAGGGSSHLLCPVCALGQMEQLAAGALLALLVPRLFFFSLPPDLAPVIHTVSLHYPSRAPPR